MIMGVSVFCKPSKNCFNAEKSIIGIIEIEIKRKYFLQTSTTSSG